MKPNIYVIGSLHNPAIPNLSNVIAEAGYEVFADWFGAGRIADDSWMEYEKTRGFTYEQALTRPAAINVFEFDKRHLLKADAVVLIAPAGKSGHLELGWALGRNTPGFVFFPDGEPERWDVMLQFATGVHFTMPALLAHMKQTIKVKPPLHSHSPNGDCEICNSVPFNPYDRKSFRGSMGEVRDALAVHRS